MTFALNVCVAHQHPAIPGINMQLSRALSNISDETDGSSATQLVIPFIQKIIDHVSKKKDKLDSDESCRDLC